MKIVNWMSVVLLSSLTAFACAQGGYVWDNTVIVNWVAREQPVPGEPAVDHSRIVGPEWRYYAWMEHKYESSSMGTLGSTDLWHDDLKDDVNTLRAIPYVWYGNIPAHHDFVPVMTYELLMSVTDGDVDLHAIQTIIKYNEDMTVMIGQKTRRGTNQRSHSFNPRYRSLIDEGDDDDDEDEEP